MDCTLKDSMRSQLDPRRIYLGKSASVIILVAYADHIDIHLPPFLFAFYYRPP